MDFKDFVKLILKPFDFVLELVSPSYPESSGTVPTDHDAMLSDRLVRLQHIQARRRRQRRLFLVLGTSIFVAGPLFARIFGHKLSLQSTEIVIAILYGFVLLAMAALIRPNEFESEIRQAEDELDLLRSVDAGMEQKAQKLFKLHQSELKKYYDQTLRQSRWIFLVGIFCLVLGFFVIGGSLWLVVHAGGGDKAIVAILGAIGGILSNFIAAVYLKMHSETIKSLTEFHNRLVLTHYLHFGNFLLAKIENRPLREKSLAQVAINLSTNQKHAPKGIPAPHPAQKGSRGRRTNAAHAAATANPA
jgi:uncharacterized membrane protein YjjP (DUF1212 family)